MHYKKQTLYNMIHKKIFVLGYHYIKPTPKKVLFRSEAMLEWLGESNVSEEINIGNSDNIDIKVISPEPISSINI